MFHKKDLVDPDPLTALPGYATFTARLEHEVGEAEQAERSVAMSLVDIDWFGKLNAEHGTAAGDGVLKELAAFLRGRFPGDTTVVRYGGDAFALLMPDTDKERAFLMMEQVRAEFEGEHVVSADGREVRLSLTISVGVAAFPDDGATAPDIERKANEALYRAKMGDRNKVYLAREERMVTKTSHYTQGQLHGLSRLATREGISEAVLLREALDDLLRKYNA